jgi:tetratricopeptide (TPR) repeat protein
MVFRPLQQAGVQVSKDSIGGTQTSQQNPKRFADALALHQQGSYPLARQLYQEIIALEPLHFDALHMLGLLEYQSGDFAQTVRVLGLALEIKPLHSSAHFNRGNAFKVLQQFEAAIASYDQVIAVKPDYAGVDYNRAMALSEIHQYEAAVLGFDKAIALKPDSSPAHFNRGYALLVLKQYQRAMQSYDAVIALKPADAVAHSNRGNCLYELHDFEGALLSYDQAIRFHPASHEAYYNRGNAFFALGQHQNAAHSYDNAIAIKADYAKANYSRGNALYELRQYYGAIDSYDCAIGLKADYPEAACNRGNAQRELGQFDAAFASYDAALALRPDFASVHWNKSLLRLLLGDFAAGWQEYEWRWKNLEAGLGGRRFAQPLWLGVEPLKGKRILLHSEQGLGDTIQFCRYAALVKALGAEVILEVPKALRVLLKDLPGLGQLIASGDPVPACDFHCPLLSLPLAFKTVVGSIPAGQPYLLSEPAKVLQWQTRLGARTGPRVGLVWSGNSENKNDANRNVPLWDLLRSLPAGVQYVSLQKEIRESDRPALQCRPDLLQFEAELQDFSDTAALCELMDVIISVDTSVAHLAGALGKTVFVLLPFTPDWRWLMDRSDSPWYESATLYRQEKTHSWDKVLYQLKAGLIERLQKSV